MTRPLVQVKLVVLKRRNCYADDYMLKDFKISDIDGEKTMSWVCFVVHDFQKLEFIRLNKDRYSKTDLVEIFEGLQKTLLYYKMEDLEYAHIQKTFEVYLP